MVCFCEETFIKGGNLIPPISKQT